MLGSAAGNTFGNELNSAKLVVTCQMVLNAASSRDTSFKMGESNE